MIQELLYNYIYILINIILILNTNNILNINTYCKYTIRIL